MENQQEKTVAFLTLGCKVNSYETEAMKKLFIEAGYEVRSFLDKASVYIINTCTVTNMADRKSRQMLHRARKKNPDSIIAAVGCYVQASYEEAKEDTAVDLLVGNNQKSHIVEVIEEYGTAHGKPLLLSRREEMDFYENLTILDAGEKTRAYVKVQDGCNQFCTFCIIPHVRGQIRSRSIEDIVKEAANLTDKGYRELILTGIHLSSYGIDFYGEQNFAKLGGKPLLALIKELSKISGLERIRLGSLEPRIITEDFVKELSAIQKVCPHFHLSLQSGSDEILRRMNRKYTKEEYKRSVFLLRQTYDRPAITTDVICGFPGETKELFLETREFLKEIGFADVHIFPYSKRKGTRAATMEEQVEESVKHERSRELIALGKEMTHTYREGFLFKEQQFLLEETGEFEGKTYFTGHNERYVKAYLPKNVTMESGAIVSACPKQLQNINGEEVLLVV
jgi:threonylcarbamoyladenosine tRNA methylthiotransferase MtaB